VKRKSLSDTQRLDWLRLARTHGVGPVTFSKLIERYADAGAAIDALPRLAARGGRSNPLRPVSREQARAELDRLDELGGRLICACEPDFPAGLAVLDPPPPVISVMGPLDPAAQPACAIVGARNASAVGLRFAGDLARELGARGVTIVSGLARGIDAGAHRGALATGTIAVTAGGLDKLYPAEHERLVAAILENGAMVSEMPLGTETRAELFPRRNRIVAGLSLAVVVVEAAQRSGSLITARYALEEGRELCAVPGSPIDPRAAGPNQLLRAGATFVESAADVLAALPETVAAAERPPLYGYADRLPNHLDEADDGPLDRDDDHAARLLEALGATAVTVDELCRQCHLSSVEVARLLAELELDGRLERHPGQYVSLR